MKLIGGDCGLYLQVFGHARMPKETETELDGVLIVGPINWAQHTYGHQRIGFGHQNHETEINPTIIDGEIVVNGLSWSDWNVALFSNDELANEQVIEPTRDLFDASAFMEAITEEVDDAR